MTEGQGQRDDRGSGSERRQKFRVREMTGQGRAQRDDRRSGSESQQNVRVREMTGQDQGDNRMSGSGR